MCPLQKNGIPFFSNLSDAEIVDAGVFALKKETEIFDREEMRQRRVKLWRMMLQTSQKLLENVAIVKTVVNGSGKIQTEIVSMKKNNLEHWKW